MRGEERVQVDAQQGPHANVRQFAVRAERVDSGALDAQALRGFFRRNEASRSVQHSCSKLFVIGRVPREFGEVAESVTAREVKGWDSSGSAGFDPGPLRKP